MRLVLVEYDIEPSWVQKVRGVVCPATTAGVGADAGELPLVMDRAYEGDETRQLVLGLGIIPVVPPKFSRLGPWTYNRELYKKRDEIERPFCGLKGFRRIFNETLRFPSGLAVNSKYGMARNGRRVLSNVLFERL